MNLPTPATGEYLKTITVVLATLAVLQFIGGEPDLSYFVGVGVVLPIIFYLLTLITVNVDWLPTYDKLIRDDG